jgi:hypothetical protein
VEEIHIDPGEDIYTIEASSVEDFILAGQRSPEVMPWEESLANMRTLDRWRRSIGLTYEADRPPVDRHAAASVLEG